MARPLLLSMIVDTLLDGGLYIDGDQRVSGPSTLYTLYTNTSIDRESGKGQGRNYFNATERRIICHLVAMEMFSHSKLEVQHSDIEQAARRAGRVTPSLRRKLVSASQEAIVTDIRTCSFLSGSEEGMYRFTHKTFMEFFVAQNILDTIMRGNKIPEVSLNELPKEIIYFVAGFTIDVPEFRNTLLAFIREPRRGGGTKNLLYRNIIASLLQAGDTTLQLNDVSLGQLDFSKVKWSKHQFQSVSWTQCNFRHVSWDSSVLARNSFRSCTIMNCELSQTAIHGEVADVTIEDTSLRDSTIDVSSADFRIRECRVDASDIKIVNDVVIAESQFNRSTVRIELGTRNRAISTSRFEDCTITLVQPITVGDPKIRVKDCLVLGLTDDGYTNYQSCRGVLIQPNDDLTGSKRVNTEGFNRQNDSRKREFIDGLIRQRGSIIILPQMAIVTRALLPFLAERVMERLSLVIGDQEIRKVREFFEGVEENTRR